VNGYECISYSCTATKCDAWNSCGL
jgi:hypothetical protein